MFRPFFMCALLLGSASAMAQMTPVGLWQTISDADGKPQGEVRVTESAGVISAVLEKALVTSPEPNCDKCTDDRKGKPKVGLQIIRDARKTEGKDVWEGGNILDPNREVAPQYQAYTFEFTAGPPATGFIVTENSAEITLRQPGGVDRTFARAEVASMKGLGRSIMP